MSSIGSPRPAKSSVVLADGEPLNRSEARPALHTALRKETLSGTSVPRVALPRLSDHGDLLGAHISTSGGLHTIFERAAAIDPKRSARNIEKAVTQMVAELPAVR